MEANDETVREFLSCGDRMVEESVVDFSAIAVETIKGCGCFLDYAKGVMERLGKEGGGWQSGWGQLYALLKSVWEYETKFKVQDCQERFYKLYSKSLIC